jgi:hypothetical protein
MELEDLFFAAAFLVAATMVLTSLDFASTSAGVDHVYHELKFELLLRHGFAPFPELGDVSPHVLIPPFLLLFYPLLFVLGARLTYALMYLSIPALAALAAGRLGVSRRAVLASLLFPPCIYAFFRTGRLLELLANAFFLLLFLYLKEGRDPKVSALLFFFGVTSHPPTAVIYAPPLVLLALDRKLHGHLRAWAAVSVVWVAIYLPPVAGSSGMLFPKLAAARVLLWAFLPGPWAGALLAALLVALAAVFLARFGADRRYFAAPLVLLILSLALPLLGVGWLEAVPGINQLSPYTFFIVVSYVLWANDRRLWTAAALSLLFLGLFELPGMTSELRPVVNLTGFDFINGSYVVVKDCRYDEEPECGYRDPLWEYVANYLARRGLPSPMCSTWEYSDPYWFFYDPQGCGGLNSSVDYTLLPAEIYPWAANCTGSRLVDGYYVVPT